MCCPNCCTVALHFILNWCDSVDVAATVTNTVAWDKFFMLDLGKGSRLRTQTRMLSKSAVDERKEWQEKKKGHGCMKTALGRVSCYREGACEIFRSGIEINFSLQPFFGVLPPF